MRTKRFDWTDGAAVAAEIRFWVAETAPEIDVEPLAREVIEDGDAAVLRLSERFDGKAPASPSMPTRPNAHRFASCTQALPGPTTTSTAATLSVPQASATTAWAPPIA